MVIGNFLGFDHDFLWCIILPGWFCRRTTITVLTLAKLIPTTDVISTKHFNDGRLCSSNRLFGRRASIKGFVLNNFPSSPKPFMAFVLSELFQLFGHRTRSFRKISAGFTSLRVREILMVFRCAQHTGEQRFKAIPIE